ncbi:MAG: HAD-IA family hydrolase [Lachnospiraceae bacterium]|nr:HAD-IA family hydrolase [Lachnospiraceae bacterium]
MIEALSPDYHIALVTTANKKNATEILENFGRADTFEYILTGEDLTKVKPDPAGFLMAMEHFGVSAENTVIYEDSATGLAAAMASGAAVMAVKFF